MKTENISVLIFEDDSACADLLKKIIEELIPEISEINVAYDYKDAINHINQAKPDILFLDILVGDLNGLDFMRLLPEQSNKMDVIVVSGHEEFAIDAAHLHIFDFLTKPLSPKEVRRSVSELIEYRKKKDSSVPESTTKSPFIVVNRQDKTFFLKKNNIISLEADGPYTDIYTLDGRISASKTLSSFAEQLDPNTFCRIHRSQLINIEFIKEVVKFSDGSGNLIMHGGQSIMVSKQKKDKFIKLISKGEIGNEPLE